MSAFRKVIGLGGPTIGFRERLAADSVLKSGNLAQGLRVKEFETKFSAYVAPGQSGVAVNSGTSALHLSALSLGIGPGDEVIVPAFTFAASANSIALTGAKVRFADVDIDSFNLDCSSAAKLLTSKTKAIMFVHLYGNPSGIADARKFADQHGLYLIEDVAQAHGASWQGKAAGDWGEIAAFSFYPTKNMTTGEGGMVLSRNQELLSRVELFRNQGMRIRYQNEVVGFNNRMTEYAAALGIVQLSRLERFTNTRQKTAITYGRALENHPDIIAPVIDLQANHVFHQYTLRVTNEQRDAVAAKLRMKKIESATYYPIPLPDLKPFTGSQEADKIPVSRLLTREALSIPINPSIGRTATNRVALALRGL